MSERIFVLSLGHCIGRLTLDDRKDACSFDIMSPPLYGDDPIDYQQVRIVDRKHLEALKTFLVRHLDKGLEVVK